MVRLGELLQDPLRYILTVTDGLVEDYSNLPTNITASGEFTYENPFNLMSSMQLSSIESVPPVSNGTLRGASGDGGEGANPYDNSDLIAENGPGDYDNQDAFEASTSHTVTFAEVVHVYAAIHVCVHVHVHVYHSRVVYIPSVYMYMYLLNILLLQSCAFTSIYCTSHLFCSWRHQ